MRSEIKFTIFIILDKDIKYILIKYNKMNFTDINFSYKSIADCVVDFLKNQMELGYLKPGERIDEKELCKVLKVSRTPIREALIRLEMDGFVEILPRRTILVKKISLEEIRDIYQVIGNLEVEAVGMAIERIEKENINRMEELYKKMVEALKDGDIDKWIDSNLELHSIHLHLSGNKILKDIVSKLKKRLYDFPRKIVNIPEWSREMMKDHFQLIEAFKKKEKAIAKKIIKEHWNFKRSYPFIVQYYDLKNEKSANSRKYI